MPKMLQACAKAEPHCPAPVSVAMRFVPSSWFWKTCAKAEFVLCEPEGETP